MELYSNNLSCFFCLRSNSRKYLNPQDLESEFYENANDEVISSFHEFSLRNLYRYINLLHSDKEEKDFKHLKMSICEECFILNGEFNKLYNQLEETKLRLNWCVKKLQDVMTISRKGEVKISEMEGEDGDDEKILEIWRTHTLDRMEDFTRAQFPRVLLIHKNKRKRPFTSVFLKKGKVAKIRMNDEKVILGEKGMGMASSTDQENTMKQPPNSQSSLWTETDPHCFSNEEIEDDGFELDVSREIPPFPDKDTINISMECCDIKISEPYTLSGLSSSEEQATNETMAAGQEIRLPLQKKANTRNKSRRCTHCSYVCGAANISGRLSSMLKHQVRFHPEHFLLDKNEMRLLRPGRYRQILTEIVYPKFVKIKGRSTSCSLCGRSYKSLTMNENVISLRLHLLFQHKSELRNDLKIALQDPLLDESLNSCNTAEKEPCVGSNSNSNSFRRHTPSRRCPYCSYKTTSAGSKCASISMTAHLVRFHPEHYLIDEKDKAEGLWHEQFRTILTGMVYPSFISKCGHHRSCSLCGTAYRSNNIFENIQSTKKHLIFRHRLELRNKFKVALEDPNLEERLKDIVASAAPANKEKYSPNCSYCSFKCTSRSLSSINSSMVAHLVRSHPEHFLIDDKDKAAGLCHEQFGAIFKNMVSPNFISKSGHRRSCSLCGISYKCGKREMSSFMVKRHLLFNHKVEMKEKFKLCLEDPMLEERLKCCKVKTTSIVTTEAFTFKKCPYCQYKCNAKDPKIRRNSMVQHLVRLHPQYFLRDEGGGGNEEVQKILMDEVFPKFTRETGRDTLCSLCKVKYQSSFHQQNVLSLRRHLIFQHKAELKQELGNNLEKPMLGEMEKMDKVSILLN